MSSSYSSIIGNIWPPPNQETIDRLQRLKELQELRQSRESKIQPSSVTSDVGVVSDSSRANRRNLVSSYRLPTSRLRDRQGDSSASTTDRPKYSRGNLETTSLRLNGSRDELEERTSDFGGAKPKKLGYSRSLTQNDSSGSEILRELRNNTRRETGGFLRRPRERTSSVDSDTSEEQNPIIMKAKSALDENKAKVEFSENQAPDLPADSAEKEVTLNDISTESENIDPHEDIEQFKQSLYGSSSYGALGDTGASKLTPFSFKTSPATRHLDINRIGVSRYSSRESDAVSLTEKPAVRSTYNVSDGFKRIDDLFGGSSTMSKPIEQIKVRSRVKKKESDDTKSDADASADTANVIQSDIRSLHSVTESSEEVPSHRQSESTLITPTENVDITDVTLSSVARQDTEILDTPSDESDKPKRVLICDGESMVVADEEGENEILMQSCETSKIDEVDTDHVVMIEPVGSMREVEQIEIDQNSKEYHMNNEIENEHSEDSGHVIIGSVSTADMGNDTGSSILSESDSIFDYNKKYDGIDAYFDSMDKSKNITELHSRHTRRDIPSYSRTKSVPYETTGRTSRYSSLPTSSVDEKLAEFRSRFASRYADPSSETGSSTIEDRLSEIRARYSGRRDETDSSVTSEGRYSSRRIETDSFAPSELRYSSIGSSYDRDRLYSRNVETDGSLSSDSRYSYRSADTDESVLNETRYSSIGNAYDTGLRDRFHSDKVSSIGTDPTSRTDSKLSKIITKSFQSIDNYFSGPKSPEVILRRRTTRKTSDEVVGREESSSDNTMPCNVESGATLRSDITERESNDREDDMQDENDDIISSDQKSMDVSEESDKTVENMNNFLRNDSDRGVDDVTDDVTEKDNDRQDEVIEVEKYEVRPCVVESGNVICLESNMASKQENQEKTANDDDVTPVIDNLQTIELDADTVLVSDKTCNFEVVNYFKKEQTTKDGDTIQSSSVVNQTDSQNSQKSKDKKKDKKKKSKKKKGNAQKDNNSLNDNKDIESALNSENIDKRVDDVENVTSSCESSSSKSFQGTLDSANTSKASSKLAKDTDHNSDRTSIATEDLLSLVSSEGVTQVKHSNDEDKTPTADDASDTSKSRESLSVANADQYATFEGEDIPHSTQKKLDKKEICVDEYSAASTDGDNFETASETTESGEFFEAIPTEVLEGLVIGSNSAVERKEKFVYLCPKSKVRKRKIKMNSLLGTSGIKKQNKSTDRQRLGQVKAWMENNIFPTADDTSQKEVVSLKSVSSNFGSAFSVESVIGDDESKSSTLTLGNTASELSQQTVSSYTVINRCEQKSSAIQTDSVSVRNSSSQTWTKTWNIGVQVDTDQYNISTQTVLDVLCPCCKQTIDLKAALSGIPLENQQELASILPNDISGSVVNTETTENVINLTEKVEPDKQKDDFKSNLSNVTNGSGEKTKSDSSRSHSRTSSAGSSKQTSSDSSRRPSAKPSPSDSPVKVKSVPVSPSKQSANGQPLKTSRKVSPKAEVKKTSVKSRREKVADVKDLLYNTDIGKSPRVSQKPPVHTPAKSKSRENSNDRNKSRQNENKIEKCTKKSAKSNVTKTTKSREPSEDRSSTAGSELQGNTPSYMQSTRSSSRKSVQSRENSQERILNNTEAKSVAAVKEKPKVQRSESYHRARSRGNSEERTENTEISGVPSYMQPTRASTRKKSEGGTPGKEDKSKKPLINKNSHSSNEDENQDHIVSVKDNPFVQNDSSKRKKKQSSDGMSVFERLGNSVKQEQVGKGFWYRKEPIKDTSPKKVKVKSPKKSRSMSWTAIDTVFDKLTGRNAKNRRKDSAENSDTKSLGSRSSLVEIDVDNSSVVIDESQRNGTKLVFDSNEIHNVKPSIPNSNKSHQAGSSSSAAGGNNFRPCHRYY